MKFLAILRDSLREAIDTKVFYVMVGLSLLLTLFALGIRFDPVSPQQALETVANVTLNPQLPQDPDPDQLMAALMQVARKTEVYEVVNVKALDEPLRPADGRYQLVLRRNAVNRPGLSKQESPQEIQKRLTERFGRLGEMRLVELVEVKQTRSGGGLRLPGLPSTAQDEFEVTVAPTEATRVFWPHKTSILFGLVPVVKNPGVPLGFQLYFIESGLVIGLGGWVALLTSIVITAFFIPNMLRKGTIDLLLVKPIHRSTLLIYKYVGGLTFILLNTAVAVGGVWLVLGLRSELWATGFLWTILILTFFFAILYSMSTLFGVLTQSPIAAILLTCGVWFFLFLVGVGYQIVESEKVKEEKQATREKREPEPEGWFPGVVRKVHFVLPRTGDLGVLNGRLLSRELITANQLGGQNLDQTPITWGESLTVSGAFIALMLGLACWRFSSRDY